MNDEIGEDEWKRRFALFAMLRVSGLLLMLAGAFVGLTGLVAPGGLPVLGVVLAVAGAVDAMVVPRLLRARWKRGG